MARWMVVVLAVAVAACSGSSAEPKLDPPAPTQQDVSADVFAGSWRSVDPSLEFIGLTIASKSSDQGALGARLTFSGVYWEGSGRIQGDSLTMVMSVTGSGTTTNRVVARVGSDGRLRLRMENASGVGNDFTFAREAQ